MSVGYMLPDGTKNYGSGFNFTNKRAQYYYPSIAERIRYGTIEGPTEYGKFYVRAFIETDWGAGTYPAEQYNQKSGPLYRYTASVESGKAPFEEIGEITTFNYYSVFATAGVGIATVGGGSARVDEGGSATVTATVADNYKFLRWSDEADSPQRDMVGVVTRTFTGVGSDILVQAIAYTYKLSYNGNGSSQSYSQNVLPGSSVSVIAGFSRDNHTFVGWATSPTGTAIYYPGDEITPIGDLVLYAVWRRNFGVAFNANGGEGTMASINVVEGVLQPLPKCSFEREGYLLTGWCTIVDGSGKIYDDGADASTILSDVEGVAGSIVTLYAIWAQGHTFLIKNTMVGVGSLKLLNTDGDELAKENASGVLAAVLPSSKAVRVVAEDVSIWYDGAIFSIDGGLSVALPYELRTVSGGVLSGEVSFTERALFNVGIKPSVNGSVRVSEPSSPDRDGKYLKRRLVFLASADEGYEPSRYWVFGSDGVTAVANGVIIDGVFEFPQDRFTQDIFVLASFVVKKVSVFAESSSVDQGDVSASKTGEVDYATECEFSATAHDGFVFDGWYTKEGELVSLDNPFVFSATKDVLCVVKFRAAESGVRTLKISYGSGDVSVGWFSCGGLGNAGIGGDVDYSAEFGSFVDLVAHIEPGCSFLGWYSDSELTKLIEKKTAIRVMVRDTTVYAAFSADGGFVAEWEGSDSFKVMKWRSKTFVASRPFNPSSIRVDAKMYPVRSVKIEMFSSPDASAVAVSSSDLRGIVSKDPRRLPMRRPERFMQVEVENDGPVDAIIVGTSMGGIAV